MRLGEKLAAILREGDVLTLSGSMGAGKTALISGIAAGLGCGQDVSSPTFALAHEYPTQPKLVHMDAYRLANDEEVLSAGMAGYLGGDCVCAIEWPEAGIRFLPESRLDILIRGSGDEPRTIWMRPMGESWEARLEKV